MQARRTVGGYLRSAASPQPRKRRAMEPRHERIAKIALGAGARYGLELAGGYARSHPTEWVTGRAAMSTFSPAGSTVASFPS